MSKSRKKPAAKLNRRPALYDQSVTPWGHITWDGDPPFTQEQIDKWNNRAKEEEEARGNEQTQA